jgi:hypothetical protein
MLKPIEEIYHDVAEVVIFSGLRGYVALEAPVSDDGPVGAYLIRSFGRARGCPNFVLLSCRDWESPDYKRSKFKAFNAQEAIEIANRRLAKWRKAREGRG